VKNKRVVIVDDSIVRGTTCKARVKTLKEAGAKEVHVTVSCPPHMNPCVYGIDFPDRSKLMAANHSVDEIRKYLNADSLHYLSQAGMVKPPANRRSHFAWRVTTENIPCPTIRARQAHHRNAANAWRRRSVKPSRKDSEQIKLLQFSLCIACFTPVMDKQTLSPAQLAALIDHTLLKADATAKNIEKLCAEARENHFYSVCVNGSWSGKPAIFWKAPASRSRPSSVFRWAPC